jgi:hypothetical protein
LGNISALGGSQFQNFKIDFMLKNFFKTAWRNLGKSRMHSFINIVGLSFGMAVAILIGLWMYDELSFNKSFKITITLRR